MSVARLFLGLIAFGSAASAQETNTGTLVPGRESSTLVEGLSPAPQPSKSEKASAARINAINAARKTVRAYAACQLSTLDTKAEHAALVAFLKTPPQTEEATKLAKRLARPDCLPLSGADYVQVRITNDLVRGGLMRALYLDTKRIPPRQRVLPEEIASAVATGNATFDILRRFGACVVAKQRVEASRFVTSTIGSAEEIALVRALSPSLNGCLEKGRTVHFSYGVLEGVLAEALFMRQEAFSAVVVPTGTN